VSIFGRTGDGKTHLVRWGLLPLWQRYPVLLVDTKPRNRTLTGCGSLVRQFPTSMQRLPYRLRHHESKRWDRDPEWFRLRPPAARWSPDRKRQSENWTRARGVVGRALDECYHGGGWVVVIDEVRAVSDGQDPSLDLTPVLENTWQRGRDQPVTLIALTQSPVFVPGSMHTQPTHVYISGMRDLAKVDRLGEIGGDVDLIRQVLPSLSRRRHEFLYLYLGGEEGERMEIVTAPTGS
jgi:hypothetical protein